MGDARAVHAHYVAALNRRMQHAPEAVQRVLQARLAHRALADGPEPGNHESAPQRPVPAALSPLGRLNRHLAATAPSGLRSVQAFRDTWARVRAEEDVTEAVQNGPENAGPLNSHMLVLRSLEQLRALSPEYLRRFLAHADTLLWLEQASGSLRPTAGKGRPGRQKR